MNIRFISGPIMAMALILAVKCLAVTCQTPNDDPEWRDLQFKQVDEICRLRGYIAKDHYFVTPDGYNITVTRCTNPLINGGRRGLTKRVPLLLLHGTVSNPNYWVIFSRNARPRNYSAFNPSEMSLDEINKLVANDPARNNLCMLAMNFGCECWIVSRRGSPKSRRRVDGRNPGPELTAGDIDNTQTILNEAVTQLTSTSPDIPGILGNTIVRLVSQVTSVPNGDFWEFSLDEQAKYDFPLAIELVLNVTRKDKLALVGHSTGGVIPLMGLSIKPEIANNISGAVLFSPAADLGNNAQEMLKLFLLPALGAYIGPVPPIISETPIELTLSTLCSTAAIQDTICKTPADLLFGESGPNVRYLPGSISTFPKGMALREVVHLAQSFPQNSTRMFNFANKAENQEHYGQDFPPEYPFGDIRPMNLTLITGLTDGLVGPLDVLSVASKLSFEPEIEFLAPGDKWNHASYFLNSNTSNVSVIPTLRRLF